MDQTISIDPMLDWSCNIDPIIDS